MDQYPDMSSALSTQTHERDVRDVTSSQQSTDSVAEGIDHSLNVAGDAEAMNVVEREVDVGAEFHGDMGGPWTAFTDMDFDTLPIETPAIPSLQANETYAEPGLSLAGTRNRSAQRDYRNHQKEGIRKLKKAYSELKISHRQLLHENQEMSREIRRLNEILTGISSQPQEFHISDDQGRLASDFNTAGDLFNTMTPNHQDAGASSNFFPTTASSPAVPMAPPQESLDHDQLGADFVFALEEVCQGHMQTAMAMGSDPAVMRGHAIMMTAPTLADEDPMDLFEPGSVSVSEDGAITPVQALLILRSLPEFYSFTRDQLDAIQNDLKAKVRCHGFGATLERYQLDDAVHNARSSG